MSMNWDEDDNDNFSRQPSNIKALVDRLQKVVKGLNGNTLPYKFFIVAKELNGLCFNLIEAISDEQLKSNQWI